MNDDAPEARGSSRAKAAHALGAPEMIVPPPGPRSRELAERLRVVESPAFAARRDAREKTSGADQGPIVYVRGEGSVVEDADQNRYVDLSAGFGAQLLGHSPPEVVAALERQSRQLLLALGDVYASEAKVLLCERLTALFPEPGARVMLGSSGADAVTCALKTAMLASGEAGVIAFQGSYHGLSYAPLAACGLHASFREPFAAQLGEHVVFAPYPSSASDLDACMGNVRRAMAEGTIGAVLVEPILGRGGCIVPPSGFLAALREACDETGALLIADEIWTGLGRSGAWLASAAEGVIPDVVCLGKGLGGGLPISACVGRAKVMAAWGSHGGATIHTATHFGAPLACAAALATLDRLASGDLASRVASVGARFVDRLRARTVGHGVRDVRGRGLMIGVELHGGAGRALAVTRALLARGYIVLTGGSRGDVVTLTPALTIEEEHLTRFAEALAIVLDEHGS